ncbi:Glycosyl transferase family 2 [Ferrimonas sediminum]|uniref:Glycosyl transferase family 2 n=1 Tax=Ferrimonas sediminum TaxID=718193 RepID=A0A1G8Z236_9GAMM|nr:glycosyltransferase family A protein [Ferrimonas sediminum]SDK08405.1 Glycosyl transferase family 2 [Ferrimonas sediminum]
MISVIIPFYNSSKYVTDAIDSVICQKIEGIEIIVVNDGSSETESKKCQQIISKYLDVNILYYHKPNGGAASARNYGVGKSTQKYLAFLDSDDVWVDGKLSRQLSMIQGSKSGLVLTNVIVCNDKLESLYNSKKEISQNRKVNLSKLFYGQIVMNTPTILMKRSVFDMIGGFDEGLNYREDHYFLMKSLEFTEMKLVNELLTLRRQREGSLSGVESFEKEIAKHQPFWNKCTENFDNLDAIKAKNKILLRLCIYYIRNGNAEEYQKIIAGNLCTPYSIRVVALFLSKFSPLLQALYIFRNRIRNGNK